MAYQCNLSSKTLVIGFIFLFIVMSFTPSVAVDTVEKPIMPSSNGKTLYVGGSGPNNYTKIQDAINDSSGGDTVFVYDDSSPYNEDIKISKSINLIGENRETTVINGTKYKDVVFIDKVNRVNINGFTIQNSGDLHHYYSGIKLDSSSFCIISNNILRNNSEGVNIGINYCDSDDSRICRRNVISNNLFYNNYIEWGGYLERGCGIEIAYAFNTRITQNTFINNQNSIVIICSLYTLITKNNITYNSEYGMILREFASVNIIKQNNFIKNNIDAIFTGIIMPPLSRWHRNYWSDHIGIGPKIIYGSYMFIPYFKLDLRPAKEPYNIEV